MKLAVGLLAGFLAATGCVAPSTESLWAHSAAAPTRFKVNAKTEKPGIDLPASRDDFTRYMPAEGADYYVTGEGEANAMSASRPLPDSPCGATAKVAVFSFPIENSFEPRYVAYIDDGGLIGCVEKQFSYTGL